MSQYAEQAVAGALLIDAACYRGIRSIVRPSDFSSEPCAAIFRAVGRLVDANQAIDPVTIQRNAAEHGYELEDNYIMQLMELTPTAANAAEYAGAVRDAAIRRAVLGAAAQLAEQARNQEIPVTALVANGIGALQSIEVGGTKLLVSSEDASNEFLDYRDRVDEGKGVVISTGLKKLDRLLGGGMIAEGLYIMAARPGVGKSTVGMHIADYVSKTKGVLFVTLEMSREQLMARRVADRTGIGITKVLNGYLTGQEQTEVCQALSEIAGTKLFINHAPTATVSDISLMARSVPDLGMVVLDYLGLLTSENRKTSIYERVTDNSNALKRLARSLAVPVLCLAQLNRESEARKDHRPTMADLRDSGAIEQDADGIILLHRPAMYWARGQRPKANEGELMEIDLAKNRHGPTGNINMTFYGCNGRLVE